MIELKVSIQVIALGSFTETILEVISIPKAIEDDNIMYCLIDLLKPIMVKHYGDTEEWRDGIIEWNIFNYVKIN